MSYPEIVNRGYAVSLKLDGKVQPLVFLGATPEEAAFKARAAWDKEQAKGAANRAAEAAEAERAAIKRPAPPIKRADGAHGLAGLVWLINRKLKEKRRIDPANVASMLAEGWERGGPRSQV